LLEERQLRQRPLSAGDSLSVRDEGEAQFIRQLIGRYRALPAEQRRLWPELLGGVGKLGMMEGSFQAAQPGFRELAALEANPAARAEAPYNAYRAALEERQWAAALQHLTEACKIDPARFAPFPLTKYRPDRILGAGGFGVAFLAHDLFADRPVVVK